MAAPSQQQQQQQQEPRQQFPSGTGALDWYCRHVAPSHLTPARRPKPDGFSPATDHPDHTHLSVYSMVHLPGVAWPPPVQQTKKGEDKIPFRIQQQQMPDWICICLNEDPVGNIGHCLMCFSYYRIKNPGQAKNHLAMTLANLAQS